jgi:hypothetical protein
VIDFRVDEREMCYPMVPAGASNDDILLGPNGDRRSALDDGSDYAFSGLSR